MMIVVPERLTDFNRTTEELEALLIFSVAVAGKNAASVARSIDKFLSLRIGVTPFEYVKFYGSILPEVLLAYMKQCRLGKYTLMTKFFQDIAKRPELDLKTCNVEDLESLHGVGPKTARMFLLHSRPNQRFAVLDVHVLRFLREELSWQVPAVTPYGKRYREIEHEYLQWLERRLGFAPSVSTRKGVIVIERGDDGFANAAKFDLELWNLNKKGNSEQFNCAHCGKLSPRNEIDSEGLCDHCSHHKMNSLAP